MKINKYYDIWNYNLAKKRIAEIRQISGNETFPTINNVAVHLTSQEELVNVSIVYTSDLLISLQQLSLSNLRLEMSLLMEVKE